MAHIFISYAKKDTRALAEDLYNQLNQLDGITAWMDKSLEADASWARRIEIEIDTADYVVVLLSKDVMRPVTATQHRSFVLNEIDYAQQDRKAILPVLVEQVKSPVQIAGIHYIDITKNPNNPEPIIQRIRQRFSLPSDMQQTEDVPIRSNSQKSTFPVPLWMMGITIVIFVMGIWGLTSFFNLGNDDPQPSPTTEIAQQATNTSPPTNTPASPTATPDPFVMVSRNDDWTPLEQDFDGVTMVLVPAGCFLMGNDSLSDGGTSNGGRQCFDEPFWIDKTEVTQSDFERLDGVQRDPPDYDGDNRPIDDITWFEARDYCELRGGRLPTEAEWEYVARGPDELYFPWGDERISDNAVWSRNSSQGTADVASIESGVSWVGAMDMSGSVWEWTRSVYENYPYDATDGREDNFGDDDDVLYTIRGGSWGDFIINVLHSASRNGSNPLNFGRLNGFRCARSYE